MEKVTTLSSRTTAERIALTMRMCRSWLITAPGTVSSIGNEYGWAGLYADRSVIICNNEDRTTVTFSVPEGKHPFDVMGSIFQRICK
jgi:hypothetical protein